MWQVKGIVKNMDKPIIAEYSQKNHLKELVCSTYIKNIDISKYGKVLAGISSYNQENVRFPVIYNVRSDKLAELSDGDVLKLCNDGTIQRVFERNSNQNVLFLTEQCNSRCIMCPQPQFPDDHFYEIMEILKHIPKKVLQKICITGGEPTVSPHIFRLIRELKKFPFVQPMILTNGRKFSDINFTKKFVYNSPFNMIYAIPVYSSIAEVHDKIVGVKGAFNETIQGIYNLTRFRVPIEIRIVLMKQNVFNLRELSNFIGWNLPMVMHVAFMGMEMHGRAEDNYESVWVEPNSYMQELVGAVKNLDYQDINVSVYNLPLCLLNSKLWKYNKYSISSWKQGYQDSCHGCSKIGECNGFFTTSKIIPKGIQRII